MYRRIMQISAEQIQCGTFAYTGLFCDLFQRKLLVKMLMNVLHHQLQSGLWRDKSFFSFVQHRFSCMGIDQMPEFLRQKRSLQFVLFFFLLYLNDILYHSQNFCLPWDSRCENQTFQGCVF